ncbi:MAG: hypothetical protein Q8P77_02205 [Candidatus Veblenbacteria bacterium]|nr:hypothetical protein [Candidatus Veblenbacteria bacterium]
MPHSYRLFTLGLFVAVLLVFPAITRAQSNGSATAPLTVLSTSPALGAPSAPLGLGAVSLLFAQAVNVSGTAGLSLSWSVMDGTAPTAAEKGNPVNTTTGSLSFTISPLEASFALPWPLVAGTVYQLVLPGGSPYLTNQAGVPLDGDGNGQPGGDFILLFKTFGTSTTTNNSGSGNTTNSTTTNTQTTTTSGEDGTAATTPTETAIISPQQGGIVSTVEHGVKVFVPARALRNDNTPVEVRVRKRLAALNTTAVAKPLSGAGREITAAAGTQAITNLVRPVTVSLSYHGLDLATLGENVDETRLRLAYWDEGKADWVVLSSVVDVVSKAVLANVTHFTLFAIVLPFLAEPAGAQAPPVAPPEQSEPLSESAQAWQNLLAEGTKVYVSGPDSLALSVGLVRDTALEQQYEADIVRKVVGSDTVAGDVRTAIINFVTYGTVSTLALGAGERGGVVASFRAAYGHLPQSEHEWQEVVKIANGRWPGTLLPEREQQMRNTFKEIYVREAVVQNQNDSAALAIMAYGLRSAKRSVGSEAAALTTFQALYNRTPFSAADWDAVRAVAYSGAKR